MKTTTTTTTKTTPLGTAEGQAIMRKYWATHIGLIVPMLSQFKAARKALVK